MGSPYSLTEQVALLKAVVQTGAHVRTCSDDEINPIKYGIPHKYAKQVEQCYNSIILQETHNYPPRTGQGLRKYFRKILYEYGVGLLAGSDTTGLSFLRIRILNRILRDREKLNERKRHRKTDQLTSANQSPSKRRHIAAAHKSEYIPQICWQAQKQEQASQVKKEVPIQHYDSIMPDEFNVEEHIKFNYEPAEKKHNNSQAMQAEVESINSLADKQPNNIHDNLQWMAKMLMRSEERGLRADERNTMMDRVFHSNRIPKWTEAENEHDSFRLRELELEFMKTVLARRELELRARELEVREKERIWSVMEKLLT